MFKGRHILLVEDDEFMGASIVQRLELEKAEVSWLRSVQRALPAIRTPRRRVDAVVCDIKLPDGTGEDLYYALQRTTIPPPFLFITGQGGIDQAVRLLKSGAADYLTKPFDMPRFLERLVLIARRGHEDIDAQQTGISSVARDIDERLAYLAMQDVPVLIRGAPGLGKARMARRLHDLSDRSVAPLIEINALRDDDADRTLNRALAEVGEGTIYINGVTHLSLAAQQRLLDTQGRAAFRLVASDSAPMEVAVTEGAFRTDLFYLLSAHQVILPPLADRPEDALWLASLMLSALQRGRERQLRGFSPAAEAAIRAWPWPANGREVRSRLIRALDHAQGDWLQPGEIFPEQSLASQVVPLSEARDAAERAQIAAALARTNGQIAEAAKLLHVSRTTLWEKMQKLGL
jgi:DNA-binding NtrC family response regulator